MSSARWIAPANWPVVGAGLVMAAIDDVLLVHAGEGLTDEAFDRHIVELTKAIDGRLDDARIGVIYADPHMALTRTPRRRAEAARALDPRRDKLVRTTAGFVLVTDSAFSRAALRAYFQISPPPYPWWVRASVAEALRVLAPVVEGLDEARVLERWTALVRKHAA